MLSPSPNRCWCCRAIDQPAQPVRGACLFVMPRVRPASVCVRVSIGARDGTEKTQSRSGCVSVGSPGAGCAWQRGAEWPGVWTSSSVGSAERLRHAQPRNRGAGNRIAASDRARRRWNRAVWWIPPGAMDCACAGRVCACAARISSRRDDVGRSGPRHEVGGVPQWKEPELRVEPLGIAAGEHQSTYVAQGGDTPRPRPGSRTKTSASHANVACSVTPLANPTCRPRRNAPRQSKWAMARASISRSMPGGQYEDEVAVVRSASVRHASGLSRSHPDACGHLHPSWLTRHACRSARDYSRH